MQHTDRPVLRFFYNFRAYLRSSLPMALRGRGSALNSTAVIRWYSGRVRFSPVRKARTSACFSSAQQISAPIFFAHLLDHALLHLRAGVELFFQLLGADVLAAVQNDEVLLAAGHIVVAFLVHAGQVAGVEPAVFVDDLGGGFGVLIVAQHHTAAPDADLAGLIQLVLAVAVRLAQRPDMGLCLGVVHQTIAAGLGHAVALGDVHAVFHQTQQQLAVEHGRAAAGVPQAVQLIGAPRLTSL